MSYSDNWSQLTCLPVLYCRSLLRSWSPCRTIRVPRIDGFHCSMPTCWFPPLAAHLKISLGGELISSGNCFRGYLVPFSSWSDGSGNPLSRKCCYQKLPTPSEGCQHPLTACNRLFGWLPVPYDTLYQVYYGIPNKLWNIFKRVSAWMIFLIS